jgi:hypothetical protein
MGAVAGAEVELGSATPCQIDTRLRSSHHRPPHPSQVALLLRGNVAWLDKTSGDPKQALLQSEFFWSGSQHWQAHHDAPGACYRGWRAALLSRCLRILFTWYRVLDRPWLLGLHSSGALPSSGR